MQTLPSRLLLAFFLLTCAGRAEPLAWQPWSDSIFAQAAREHRFVLLNLHAVWCHWCHVMEKETYGDPQVQALLRAKYLLVEVDADARPDLANRYEDYGWPATVVFNEQGGEIVKRRGFLPPKQMASMLQAIIDDPTPGPSVQPEKEIAYAAGEKMDPALATRERAEWKAGYDTKLAGWGHDLKYLDWDNVEYALEQSPRDPAAARMAEATLAAQRQLLDPAWGGVYQYSAEGDWKHPHFEKLIQFQAENLRIFALAALSRPAGKYLATAERIHDYIRDFLTGPEGAFYVSQDADLVDGQHSASYFSLDVAGRRKLGVPRVDRHLYARENGWMIRALCMLYRATGDAATLAEARRAAAWIVEHRATAEGGFRHGEEDKEAVFLGDTLSMGRAFLELYTVGADRADLARAQAAAKFIQAHFPGAAGLPTTQGDGSLPARPQYDENVAAARFGNLLTHYTGDPTGEALAQTALRYLSTPEVLEPRHAFVGGALLAEEERSRGPLHLTVVGPKAAARAQELFRLALRSPSSCLQAEWSDPAEGPLPGEAVAYPPSPEPKLYRCVGNACSAPIGDPAELKRKMAKWLAEGS